MKNNHVITVIEAAQASGLLPEDAQLLDQENRPWPVVLLTGLGAWMAAIPLVIVLAYIFFSGSNNIVSAWVIGVTLLIGAVLVLRSTEISLFVEQLAIPGLITSLGLIGAALFETTHSMAVSAALMGVLMLGLAASLSQTGLRVLLGAWAAAALGVALDKGIGIYFVYEWFRPELSPSLWVTLHILLASGLGVAVFLLDRLPTGAMARWVAFAESTWTGWMLATLVGLAFWAGMSFLVGAGLQGISLGVGRHANDLDAQWLYLWSIRIVSALLAVAGGAWLMHRWSALNKAWVAGVVLVLAALSACMPTLGACLLVLALCAGTKRWRMAMAAALAAAWIVGAFYYALSWPLSTKALVLVAAAVLLCALAYWGLRSQIAVQSEMPRAGDDAAIASLLPRARVTWGIALSAILIVLMANVGIWQKEQLIRTGQPLFVRLQPVDPRSLMQGDYMALRFLPWASTATPQLDKDREAFSFEHPRIILKHDAQGIVTGQSSDDGHALAQDEVAIELVPKHGRWILVTDAFYFKEGEAQRWAAAKYGEFRVDANGKALLVGLRGADLAPL